VDGFALVLGVAGVLLVVAGAAKVRNPAPTGAAFVSVADTCAVGAAAPCP